MAEYQGRHGSEKLALDENIYQVRREKLAKIEALGQRSYPHEYRFTHTVPAVLAQHSAATAEELDAAKPAVRVAGRMMSVRLMGKACFAHLQQGGDPSPFDRIQASRLARLCLEYLIKECGNGTTNSTFIGLQNGKISFTDMRDFERMVDLNAQRPRQQWWLELKTITNLMAQLDPES